MIRIKPQSYRLALSFDTVFFPFTFPEISEALRQRGYKTSSLSYDSLSSSNNSQSVKTYLVSPRVFEGGFTSAPTGPRVYAGTFTSVKGNCIVRVDNNKKIITVRGNVVEEVVNSTREIMNMSESDFRVKIEDIGYLEFAGSMIVVSDKSPIRSVENFSKNYDVFRDILNTDIASYSMRIVPRNVYPSSKNWFDIQIEPRLTNPDEEFYVRIIYRNKNTENVMAFARDVDSEILLIVERIGDIYG